MNEKMRTSIEGFDFFLSDSPLSLKTQLDSGLSTNATCPSPPSLCAYSRQWTLLMRCAYEGYVECVNLLLEYRAEVNHIDEYARFALILAVRRGNVKCVSKLIKAKAGLEIMNSEGLTPLALAIRIENIPYRCDIIPKLLYAGSDLDNVKDVIPHWVLCLRDKIEQHRSTTLSLYGGYLEGKTQKKVVPPKDIILIICKMMWNKRKI